jgi:hypothetical protein
VKGDGFLYLKAIPLNRDGFFYTHMNTKMKLNKKNISDLLSINGDILSISIKGLVLPIIGIIIVVILISSSG